jgi:hypothetical protein
MRKLVLSAEALTVESFETQADPGQPGTVQGREIVTGPNGYTCQQMTCSPPSCPAYSCISQCAKGCPASAFQCTDIILDTQCQ